MLEAADGVRAEIGSEMPGPRRNHANLLVHHVFGVEVLIGMILVAFGTLCDARPFSGACLDDLTEGAVC